VLSATFSNDPLLKRPLAAPKCGRVIEFNETYAVELQQAHTLTKPYIYVNMYVFQYNTDELRIYCL